jgi:hypothetical protein
MRVGRFGWGVAAGVLLLVGVLAGCAASGKGARAEDDELPEFSAARLGDAGSGSLADDALSPAERDAARRSWANDPPMREPLDDPKDDDPFAEPEAPKPDESQADEPPKGPIGRALDATGRFFVSLASVGLSLGMAIAPMFAMLGA